MIGIVDYGLGNVMAFSNFYKYQNIDTKIICEPNDLDSIEKIILPGVGSFDNAMKMFNKSRLRDKIEKLVLLDKIPILGVCVGMQILGNHSEEGKEKGLGWIKGEIKKIKFTHTKYPLPHLGWNNIYTNKTSKLMIGVENSYFYFLHSYVFVEENIENKLACFNYHDQFTCAVYSENIYGVQFHPEKSHDAGSKLLTNFSKL